MAVRLWNARPADYVDENEREVCNDFASNPDPLRDDYGRPLRGCDVLCCWRKRDHDGPHWDDVSETYWDQA